MLSGCDSTLARRRLTQSIYSEFGHGLFITKSGEPAYWGKLNFGKATHDPTLQPAPFIVLSTTSSPVKLAKFLTKTWRLPLPDVIISVSGSAQGLTLTPELQQTLDRGLISVASSLQAWFFSGGTDTGVMKVMGDLKHRHRSILEHVPLIGVTPWGAVNQREPLERTHGKTVAYDVGSPADRQGAPLNPHHSHFVLVDAGKRGDLAWSTETPLRSQVSLRLGSSSAPVPLEVPPAHLGSPAGSPACGDTPDGA